MKKERKEALLACFPPVPERFMNRMNKSQKHITENFAVFLTHGNELFARCYHLYYNGELRERQRYVFAPDGFVRYGIDNNEWRICTRFREPVFHLGGYGYFDNSYTILNADAIYKSCMRYSQFDKYTGGLAFEYLKLYHKHPNLEYIMKSGYGVLLDSRYKGYYQYQPAGIIINTDISWKSNNLLKMLSLNRTEFAVLKGQESLYPAYKIWREHYPGYDPSQLVKLCKAFGYEVQYCIGMENRTGVRPHLLAEYLRESKINRRDYADYITECETLGYNMHDSMINRPKDFASAHGRTSQLIVYKENKEVLESFDKLYESRKELEFADGRLILRQPENFAEIIAEGRKLSHCVGGYAKRHAMGRLNIMFIRMADEPDKPFYTLELSAEGGIVQVRGYKNHDMTAEVQEFVKKYEKYISEIFKKKEKKSA